MRPSKRLELIPPYLFAELERKIEAKRAAGVDVISLGIGDPDMPTYAPIVAAAQRAVADPSTHQYPSNRGRKEFREAVAAFYPRRFGVDDRPRDRGDAGDRRQGVHLQPEPRVPRSRRFALAADPGYPVYTGGPLLAGAEAALMPLIPERGFAPDLDAIGPRRSARAADVPQLPK